MLSQGDKYEEIGVSLTTPESIRRLQRKLYVKAKREPQFGYSWDIILQLAQLEQRHLMARNVAEVELIFRKERPLDPRG